MKKSVFTFWVLIGISTILTPQEVIEVQQPNLSKTYLETIEKLEDLRDSPDKAIKLLNNALPKIEQPYERFNIIFFELATLLCEKGEYNQAFKLLKKGQSEGLYYGFLSGQNKFPPYLANIEKLEGFKEFIDENAKIRAKAQGSSKFEYVVKLPFNFTKDKDYPLLIVLYGGFGSHIPLMQDWHSPQLESEFITAYMQGDQCVGSYLKSYQRDNASQFVAAYKQIVAKYPVDERNVIVGAQSAGANHSFMLMLDELIPVKGLLLAFPGTPQLDPAKIKKAAERKCKVVLLAGENDPRVIRTKEMAVDFDKAGLANRLIISSEKGHEFPDDFPKQIDLSLKFILNKEEQ